MTTNDNNQFEEEVREDVRKFIMDNLDRSPIEVLDDLASFYDGDPCDLF